MACSPFNAARVLQQCANENQSAVPDEARAAQARDSILSYFYMDDLLDSMDTPSEAATLARDITTILQHGRFRLCKWNSNAADVLFTCGLGSSSSELNLGATDAKVLGLHWAPITGELFFQVRLDAIIPVATKRQVLSEVAKIFDPLGLLAPVSVKAKILMQLTWAAKIDWDTPLPPQLREKWLKFRSAIPAVAELRIPPKGHMQPSFMLEVLTLMGQSELVTARTKVSPLKAITIPRLELCAAHLLVTTMVNAREVLQLSQDQCMYWSDSSIVLSWIRKSPSNLMQYVSNRVAYIQQHSSISHCHHIRTKDNPADCASRGITPQALSSLSLWWKGPEVIYDQNFYCGQLRQLDDKQQQEHDAELRVVRAHLCTLTTPRLQVRIGLGSNSTFIPLVERFSTIQRVLHTTAYVLRFRPAGKSHWHTPVITANEIQQAFILHGREAQ
ncbi:PREDICTED: uncharacterized protein LOC108371963, partial [Rhagoletis zephyria]|uniref:uncharacterized protein LOC108371963 n=1 Tax=Rhagoletis zephyria TaxID=28612 RepID=UPI00081171F4